jgi:uncharacterized protein
MNAIKLLFSGPMGAGKTTAIAAISEIPPLITDALNNDQAGYAKATTTVAFDYGQVTLDGGEVLRLYGTPGQERFDYMWQILGQGALGVVLLMDNSREDALSVFDRYLLAFKDFAARGALVVGVGRTEQHRQPNTAAYAQRAAAQALAIPIFSVDVRRASDVRLLLSALIAQLEIHQHNE